MSLQRSDIRLDVNGKPLNAYLVSDSKGGPGVLVLPSWWGLKPFFKQVCDRLAEHGYTALAPDYYHGRIGHTIDEAKALQQEAEGEPDAMAATIKAAKDHLASLRTGESMGILGFSIGTDWAILSAASAPNIAAIILFYGYYSVDFSHMKSKVLGHYAETDEWQPLAGAKEMEEGMKAAGVDVNLHVYPGTAHWFMEADRPEYDPAAASLAWERTLEFLK